MSGAPNDYVVIRLATFPGDAELQAQQGLMRVSRALVTVNCLVTVKVTLLLTS